MLPRWEASGQQCNLQSVDENNWVIGNDNLQAVSIGEALLSLRSGHQEGSKHPKEVCSREMQPNSSVLGNSTSGSMDEGGEWLLTSTCYFRRTFRRRSALLLSSDPMVSNSSAFAFDAPSYYRTASAR